MMFALRRLLLFSTLIFLCNGCEKKHFGSSSFVCVCNSASCVLPGNYELPTGKAVIYTNTKDHLRFSYTTENIRAKSNFKADSIINLNHDIQYQSIIGFGGAFTDSAGITIKNISLPLQNNLIRAYFGDEGAGYNLCRIPIGGTDFSTRQYSYDDIPNDKNLEHFSLTEEDYSFKIPYIKKALELSSKDVYLFGSPWSPPSWMKTNGMFNGTGQLFKEMWRPWVNYIVKFVNQYETELNKKLWGLTTQNEPKSGIDNWKFNCCGWTPSDIRDWIASTLGPTLETAGLGRLKIMATDVTRRDLKEYMHPILTSENSSKYVDGVSVHWYFDGIESPSILDDIHELSPEKFMIYSEACEGYIRNDVILGSWERGESYFTSMIETMNHWQAGWVDWNIALNMDGGPNWAGNYVDAPIIINNESDEFYLQPMYVAITHFSKFVDRDSRRINFTISDDFETDIRVTSVINPDKTTVVILSNLGEEERVIELRDKTGHVLTKILQPNSWHTIKYDSNLKEPLTHDSSEL